MSSLCFLLTGMDPGAMLDVKWLKVVVDYILNAMINIFLKVRKRIIYRVKRFI